MEWWINLLKVIGKTLMLMVMSAFMRLQYWIDPSAKQRDLEKLGTSGNGKYDPDPESVTSNYLWTWKMISKRFTRLMQDINKVAQEFESAPNPKLFDPTTGEARQLLSVATKSVPLVVNFGSCT